MTLSASLILTHISSTPQLYYLPLVHFGIIPRDPHFLYAHENPRFWKSGMLLTTADSSQG